jgi:hypothetical protein
MPKPVTKKQWLANAIFASTIYKASHYLFIPTESYMQLKTLSIKSIVSSPVMAAHLLTALVLTTLMVATYSQSASARSILPEQNEAAAARDAVGDAMSKIDDLNKRIKSQEELLAREQERLQQYQNEKAQTEKDLESRKAIFEQKSKVLDEAWKSRNNY